MPFVEKIGEAVGEYKAAVIIIDDFKGQITPTMNELLEQRNIYSCSFPPNMTEYLQPMDLSINTPVGLFYEVNFRSGTLTKSCSN